MQVLGRLVERVPRSQVFPAGEHAIWPGKMSVQRQQSWPRPQLHLCRFAQELVASIPSPRDLARTPHGVSMLWCVLLELFCTCQCLVDAFVDGNTWCLRGTGMCTASWRTRRGWRRFVLAHETCMNTCRSVLLTMARTRFWESWMLHCRRVVTIVRSCLPINDEDKFLTSAMFLLLRQRRFFLQCGGGWLKLARSQQPKHSFFHLHRKSLAPGHSPTMHRQCVLYRMSVSNRRSSATRWLISCISLASCGPA